MFGAILRGTAVLVAGAMILWAVGPVSENLADQNEQFAEEEYGDNSRWTNVVSEWYPLVIVATIAAIFIGSAIARRRQVRI
jgi:hypothetical protein